MDELNAKGSFIMATDTMADSNSHAMLRNLFWTALLKDNPEKLDTAIKRAQSVLNMNLSQVLAWTIKGLWREEKPYYGILVAAAASPHSGKKTASPGRGALRCLERLLSLKENDMSVWDPEQLAEALSRAQRQEYQEAVALLESHSSLPTA